MRVRVLNSALFQRGGDRSLTQISLSHFPAPSPSWRGFPLKSGSRNQRWMETSRRHCDVLRGLCLYSEGETRIAKSALDGKLPEAFEMYCVLYVCILGARFLGHTKVGTRTHLLTRKVSSRVRRGHGSIVPRCSEGAVRVQSSTLRSYCLFSTASR